MSEKLILITNDDGYDAPGVKKLIEIASKLGRIIVVCPDGPRSGQSHAVTISHPLRKRLVNKTNKSEHYISNGTPVDCVKLAMHSLVKQKPDLLLSGINHGANSSVNVFYSGTMAAVIEACMLQIPAIGFSTFEDDYSYDMTVLEESISEIITKVLNHNLPYRTCLNVNFPLNYNSSKGYKVCRMGEAYWKEEFEERYDTHNNPYYWLKGTFVPLEMEIDTDIWAIKNGFASVVPIKPDLTAYKEIELISNIIK